MVRRGVITARLGRRRRDADSVIDCSQLPHPYPPAPTIRPILTTPSFGCCAVAGKLFDATYRIAD